MPSTYQENNHRERFLDEYTGDVLDPKRIRRAIIEELDYFSSRVWKHIGDQEHEDLHREQARPMQMSPL